MENEILVSKAKNTWFCMTSNQCTQQIREVFAHQRMHRCAFSVPFVKATPSDVKFYTADSNSNIHHMEGSTLHHASKLQSELKLIIQHQVWYSSMLRHFLGLTDHSSIAVVLALLTGFGIQNSSQMSTITSSRLKCSTQFLLVSLDLEVLGESRTSECVICKLTDRTQGHNSLKVPWFIYC